jgi:iron complex outermembrane receptor protein
MSKFSLSVGLSTFGMIAFGVAGAQADTVPPAAPAPDAVETITVYAQGSTRQIQSIDQQTLQDAAPGTSPIKAISELPGVNYTSADTYGAYEWATRISVRGFNQNQLGFTLDDVPLGDMTYGNWNGLHISRAIINENISKAVLSQGTGALGTASNSNLGGTLQFISIDPADTFTSSLAQSFGSNADYRTYARVDSGLLPSDTKFALSIANQESDKWKGVGGQHDLQFNSKLVQTFGDNTLTAFLNYSDRAEADYQDLSKEYKDKLGYGWDNYGNWATSVAAAQGIYTHGENTTSDPLDAAYYGGSGLRKDLLGGATFNAALNDALNWKTTFYGHNDDGRGLWFTPYQASPDGSPISLRTSEYTLARGGLLSSLSYDNGPNNITGGVWYEKENFDLARRFYATTLDSPVYDLYDFPNNSFYTQWAFNFDINVLQGYIQDTYKITDTVTASAGFKAIRTDIDGKLVQGTGYASGSIDASSPFLPQAGINWQITPNDEVFADAAENMRSFQAGGPGYGASPFQESQAVFDATKGSLKPETSYTEEVGYRLKRGPVTANLVGYHVNFENRLLAIAECAGIVGCPNTLANVGSVTSNGVEIAGSWHFLPGFTWYNGAGYDHSSYDNNVTSGGVTYNTANKIVVDSPEFMYKTKLSYEHEGFFANLTGDYMSKRYYTYTDDNSVSGRMLWDVGVGYGVESLGGLHDIRVQFNVTNLFNTQYYSSIGTNGFTMSDPAGTFQTLQVGAPRAFFGTISAKF